jgi:glucose-6-phosphate-specific signal transduction histidine kinase
MRESETAVYLSRLAALDNAAKHAGSAPATVRVWDHGNVLHFTISVTGQDFDQRLTVPGAGITNMHAVASGVDPHDRLPPHGTTVQGSVPLRHLQQARPGFGA